LEEFHPDIVSIATPADTHRDIAEFATRSGCHLVCEKPLATNSVDARAMLVAVERAGVKHGYAATGRYSPTILQSRLLIAQGVIGRIHDIESFVRMNLPVSLLPYCWFHCLGKGGGVLNNVFTHKLEQVLHATQGSVIAATGEARLIGDRAPVGPTIHDFRDMVGLMGTWDPQQAKEWEPVDADMVYTVTAQVRMADGNIANALFRGTALGTAQQPECLIFHGDSGSLSMSGSHGSFDQIQLSKPGQVSWDEVPISQEIVVRSALTTDFYQRCWNKFFQEFVADVGGGTDSHYPTFRDGSTAVEVMEIARAGYGWRLVPGQP
jgi:predicted dehydrogenase